MNFVPTIAPGLAAFLGAEYVALFGEDENYHISGSDVTRVVSLVDGKADVNEIVRRLRRIVPAHHVRQIVRELREQRLLVAAGDADPALSYLRKEAGGDQCPTKLPSVAIYSQDSGDAGQLRVALAGMGVQIRRTGDFTAAIVPDLLAPGLDQLNATQHALGRPWLLIKPGGRRPSIGPLFIPGRTGCWACLAHRLKENRWLETRIFGARYVDRAPVPDFRPLETTALAILLLAANHIATWVVAPREHPLAGRVCRLGTSDLRPSVHVLSRRPGCPVCGRPGPQRPRHIALRDYPALIGGGGYRAVPPEETVARLEHLVSPVTGIVARLDCYGTAPTFIYGATHVLPLPTRSAECRIFGRPGIASGKGTTEAEAKAGCLAEAVERYSAVFQGEEPRVRARASELPGKAVISPQLLHFSEAQYAGRAAWNRVHGNFQRVPEPFDESCPIEWSKARSLLTGRTVYLPTAYCYLQYRDPHAPEHCYANSNGCAAGNVFEEALLQGLLELIERDAIALWWYNRVSRPAVDLDSFQDPLLCRIAGRLRARHRTLAILDLTTDLETPVFAAVSATNGGRGPLFGFGSHLDPRIALTRALTELEQVLSTMPAARTPRKVDLSGSISDYRRWLRRASIENQPYLLPSARARGAGDYPLRTPAGLLDCLSMLLRRCASACMDVLAVDLTRADIGFPVARVVVPGLRQCWAQLGPGRLYDVPVTLGWLSGPRHEHELNPFPFFL